MFTAWDSAEFCRPQNRKNLCKVIDGAMTIYLGGTGDLDFLRNALRTIILNSIETNSHTTSDLIQVIRNYPSIDHSRGAPMKTKVIIFLSLISATFFGFASLLFLKQWRNQGKPVYRNAISMNTTFEDESSSSDSAYQDREEEMGIAVAGLCHGVPFHSLRTSGLDVIMEEKDEDENNSAVLGRKVHPLTTWAPVSRKYVI